jgi:phosphatidylglycerol:prolipoprotein diacylglycerol transferase
VAGLLAARLAWKSGWSSELSGLLPVLAVVGAAIVLLLPRLIDPDLDGLPIRGYGLMLLLAVVAGVVVSAYRARRAGLDPEVILSLATWFFVSGILGARLFFVIEYWKRFQKPTLGESLVAVVNLTQGGLVVYGSLLAGGAALVVFIYKNRLPGLAFADLIAPGVVLGVGLGRIGCFLNGCCYGGISDLPWAVQFPASSPAYLDQMERGELYVHGLAFAGKPPDPAVIGQVEPDSPAASAGLKPGQHVTAINGRVVDSVEQAHWALLKVFGSGNKVSINVAGDPRTKTWTIPSAAAHSRPVHPTQLYSLFDALLLCCLLLAYEPFKRRDGELTALVLIIHPISRFLLEMIRVDEAPVFNTGMSISQNISIAILAGGVALWVYLSWHRPRSAAWPAALAVHA